MSTTRFRSLAEHRDTIRSAPMTLRAKQTVEMEVELDLVAWFEGLGRGKRDDYLNMDMTGYDDWEKPMVYLSGVLAETEVVEPMLGEDSGVCRVDFAYAGERVTHVNGTPVVGPDGDWGPDHFDRLVEQVEWMQADVSEPDPWAPGPNDIPLFDVS